MEEEISVLPKHVGFIMDGNGRWAKARNKPRTFGHQKGADVIYEIVSACFNRGIEAVSLYAFSTENWSRPREEIDKIFDLLRRFLKKYSATLLREKIRLIISGDLSALPDGLREECERRIGETKEFSSHTLNIAINYGSRAEILRAVNLLKGREGEVGEEEFSSCLYTAGLPDVDLVVRTSGEQRLSNFFLWQCAYSEFYFTEVLWPDFHEKQLTDALVWFSRRKRRFGGV